MRLELDTHFADGYRSASQRARRITEGWVHENLYCAACPSPRLERTANNTRVVDFVCPSCGSEYQVKAKAVPLGRRLRDAAFEPMMERAKANRSPHFAFLGYDGRDWRVERLWLVPGHFITPDVIERCRPLSAGARRAGWVGCNILLERIPLDGRVAVVCGTRAMLPHLVRTQWDRFAWLGGLAPERRGWTVDVLRCIRTFGGGEFALGEAYAFEAALAKAHPENRNVRPKIRQQLQVLRDRGVLRFLGRGRYVAV